MTFVIAEPCVGTRDQSCVQACPVDCIYDAGDHFYIHTEECIDCGACEPECPVDAIFPEDRVPEEWTSWIERNQILTEGGTPPPLPGIAGVGASGNGEEPSGEEAGDTPAPWLEFTPRAEDRLRAFIEAQDGTPPLALRIGPGGDEVPYTFSLVPSGDGTDGNGVSAEENGSGAVRIELGELNVVLDGEVAEALQGALVDFVERDGAEGFEVRPAGERSAAPDPRDERLRDEVAAAVEEDVNPIVAAHGCHARVAAVRSRKARIRLSAGTGASDEALETLLRAVERLVESKVPGLSGAEATAERGGPGDAGGAG